MAQGVPVSLRPRIFLTFGTTRVVGRQPKAPAAFTPREIPGIHFQRLSRPQGSWLRQEPRKNSPLTPPGIDPGTFRIVAQCLNHYATSGPHIWIQLHKTVLIVCTVWVESRGIFKLLLMESSEQAPSEKLRKPREATFTINS